jgi:preprotein translocase subunit YajC
MSTGRPPDGPLLLMHLHLLLLAQSTTPTTAAKSTKSSSSYVPLLIIILVFAAVYFLFLRPRQQRLRQQQTTARELAVGDEVMSAGGIFGRVVALDANEVEVEVAPGVVMTFIRRSISARTPPSGPGRSAPPAVDEPWDREPDGPGDTAGPPGGSTGGGTFGGGIPPDPGPTGA